MPVPISGLATDIDVEGVIKKLVEVEKIPLKRLEEEKQLKENEIKAWEYLKNEAEKLNDISKELYGFRNVFKEKSVIDNPYFTLTPSRAAEKSKHKIEVLSLASSHKILSDPILENKNLPPVIFQISVGNETKKIEGFKNGGSPLDFVNTLNKEAADLINAQIIKSENDKVIISIESKKTGEKNKINIEGLTKSDEKFFEDIGIISQSKKYLFSLNFDDFKPINFEFTKNDYNNTQCALFQFNKEYQYIPDKKLFNLKNGKLKFVYKFELPSKEAIPVTEESQKLLSKNIGSVTIKDVTVNSADIILNEILEKPVEKKEVPENFATITIENSKGELQRFEIPFSEKWTNYEAKIELSEIEKIIFKNNSLNNFLLDDFSIEPLLEQKEFKNVVQLPEDAKIKIDGILVTRDRNEDLNDIINNATITLKEKTPSPVEFEIKEDAEKIKEKLNKFVEQYNNLLETLIELGKTSTGSKPGEYKKEERGLLSNDISIMNLQSKLRATVVDSYPTSLGNKLVTIGQIGISTGKWGSAWSDIKQGLLKIDENLFNSALNNFGEKIGELFGYDSNNDKIIDTGVAFKLSEILKPYVAPKGLIDGKISLAKIMIENTKDRIAQKEESLKKYEQSLREKFGKMESAMQQYKGMSQALDNALGNVNTAGETKKKKNEE